MTFPNIALRLWAGRDDADGRAGGVAVPSLENEGVALLRRALLTALGDRRRDHARARVAERAGDRGRARSPDTAVRSQGPGTTVPVADRRGPREARRADELPGPGLAAIGARRLRRVGAAAG